MNTSRRTILQSGLAAGAAAFGTVARGDARAAVAASSKESRPQASPPA